MPARSLQTHVAGDPSRCKRITKEHLSMRLLRVEHLVCVYLDARGCPSAPSTSSPLSFLRAYVEWFLGLSASCLPRGERSLWLIRGSPVSDCSQHPPDFLYRSTGLIPFILQPPHHGPALCIWPPSTATRASLRSQTDCKRINVRGQIKNKKSGDEWLVQPLGNFFFKNAFQYFHWLCLHGPYLFNPTEIILIRDSDLNVCTEGK